MVTPPLLCSESVFVLRPNWELLVQAYDDYQSARHPEYGKCPETKHNCAVRMSIALYRAGSVTLEEFGSQADARSNRGRSKRVHRGRCGLKAPHVRGAQELAYHLHSVWSNPREVYRRGGDAPAAIKGRNGIVFFKNCYNRKFKNKKTGKVTKRKTGDHIDLWNGSTFWNIKLGISAGGGRSADAPLFGDSAEVWFFQM